MTASPDSLSGRLGRFASFNVSQQVWLAVLSLVGTPILYHGLGSEAYGILAVVNVLAAQLAVLEFGFGHATIRWLSTARATGGETDIERILATSFWVFAAVAVVGGVGLFLARGILVERFFQIPKTFLPTARLALAIGSGFFVTSILGNLAGAAWQGFQRFGAYNLIGAVGSTLQIVGSIGLVLAGGSVLHVVAWSTFLGAVLLVVHAWGLRGEFSLSALGSLPDSKTFRAMASFGLMLMLAGLFSQVYLTTGSLVLGHYVLVGTLPFFTVPFGIFQRLYRLASGISAALFPLISELDGMDDRETLGEIFTSGTRVLFLAGLTFGLPAYLLAGPFLELWMGSEFAAEATPVLEVLIVTFVLVLTTVPSVELARGSGRSGRVATYVGILAATNLIGVIVLAPRFGVEGAALAFLLAQAVGSVVLVSWSGRGQVLRLFEPKMIGSVVVVALTVFILDSVASTIVWRLVGASLICATIATLGYTWVLSPKEKDVLRRSLGGLGFGV